MDLGFGAFLDKFEEHFGKRLTKLLIGLIAMAVVVICAGLLYKGAVSPVVAFVAASSKYDATIIRFVRIGWAVAAVGVGLQIGVGLSQNIRTFFASRMLLKSAKLIVGAESISRSSRKISKETYALHEEAKANLAQTREIQSAAIETVRAVLDRAKRDIDPMKVAELDEYMALLEKLYHEAEKTGIIK